MVVQAYKFVKHFYLTRATPNVHGLAKALFLASRFRRSE